MGYQINVYIRCCDAGRGYCRVDSIPVLTQMGWIMFTTIWGIQWPNGALDVPLVVCNLNNAIKCCFNGRPGHGSDNVLEAQ
jgi:hypothetical protein